MTEHDDAAARFAGALRRLHEQAGCPSYDRLIRLASERRPPVRLSRSALSDWLSGKTLPASEPVVVFVVSALAASIADPAVRDTFDLGWWRRAWRQARTEKRARLGRRPVTASAGRTSPAMPALGQPIADLDDADAFGYGVHRALDLRREGDAIPALPEYLPRAHDVVLRELIDQTRTRTRLVVVVGGSTTGKTRACWEAVRVVLPDWRIWHPLAPTRARALVEGVRSRRLAAKTVVWLDEAQLYLASAPGERAAAVLHELLHQSADGPVLIVATMWPQYWHELTTSPASDVGPQPDGQAHAAARALLQAADRIVVPRAFLGEDVARCARAIAADPRLATAAAQGADGRLTQNLAGAAELTSRYELADDPARAILWTAMDARRLGLHEALPEAFLRAAALHYLDRQTVNELASTWWEDALSYLRQASRGIPGALIQERTPDNATREAEPERYRLADYLDELGRDIRKDSCPPAGFWAAAGDHVDDPGGLVRLAHEARRRGRDRRASQLEHRAADLGSTEVLHVWAAAWIGVGEPEGAIPVLRRAAEAGDRSALVDLASVLDRVGATADAQDVLERALRADGSDTDPRVLTKLAELRANAGDTDAARGLLGRALTAGASVLRIADLYDQIGDQAAARQLLDRAVAGVRHADDSASKSDLFSLVWRLDRVGDGAAAEALARQALRHGDTEALNGLVISRSSYADPDDLGDLLRMAIDANATTSIQTIAFCYQRHGDMDRAKDLLAMAAERGDTWALQRLGEILARQGDFEGAEAALRRAIDAGHTPAYVELAEVAWQSGRLEDATRLARRAADAGHAHELRNRTMNVTYREKDRSLGWLSDMLDTIGQE